MARINIEESLFKDNRFIELCLAEGSRKAAIGALVELWLVAQGFAKVDNPKALFSEKEFIAQKLSKNLLNTGFAVLEDGVVHTIGAEKSFEWLVKAQVSGKKGGIASGTARHSDFNNLEARNPEATLKPPSRVSNPLTLTLTPTLPLPLNLDPNLNLKSTKTARKKLSPEETEKNRKIFEAFSQAYRKRYGIEPIKNQTINSQVNTLRKKVGADEAVKLVEFYLTHQDAFFLKNTHTFGHCVSSAETLRTQMLKGKAITNSMVRTAEKKIDQQETLNAIDKWEN